MDANSRVCRNCSYVLDGLGHNINSCPECGQYVGSGIFTQVQFLATRSNRSLVRTIFSLLIGGSASLIANALLDFRWGWMSVVSQLSCLAVPLTLFACAMHSLSLDKHYEHAPRRTSLEQFVFAGIFALVGSFLWILVTVMIGLCVAMIWYGIRGLTK